MGLVREGLGDRRGRGLMKVSSRRDRCWDYLPKSPSILAPGRRFPLGHLCWVMGFIWCRVKEGELLEGHTIFIGKHICEHIKKSNFILNSSLFAAFLPSLPAPSLLSQKLLSFLQIQNLCPPINYHPIPQWRGHSSSTTKGS